ncbi:MLO-like protein 15 [Eucalyptus grandis]|uniref:MLO-like protein 15 n=1 Tax=Eucalyptus grandis TaxID=71139 RepID=UPI00192E8D89|nr:MLO-like protein 15 [Eucalyptus grandis]
MVIIGIKLERMIMQLAKEVAKKHKQDKDECSENSEGDLAFEFSEDDFWFAGPKLVGDLLHFLLFVNSLELAFFFFIMFQYGFHSCIMGKVGFVVPRIVMGVIIQTLCSTRILPLHAIIQSQMYWRKKQSDKRKKIRKIKMHLEEYLSNKHMEGLLDEEEEMEILNSILVMIRKEPNSPEESTNIELARTDLREGSVRSNVSDS